jgi:hypothetical protein
MVTDVTVVEGAPVVEGASVVVPAADESGAEAGASVVVGTVAGGCGRDVGVVRGDVRATVVGALLAGGAVA